MNLRHGREKETEEEKQMVVEWEEIVLERKGDAILGMGSERGRIEEW